MTQDSVLTHTRECTVREQEEQYLVYNAATDELHLIPPAGRYLYELCDGLATVGEIAAAVAGIAEARTGEAEGSVVAFLQQLVDRGVLRHGEPHPDADGPQTGAATE
ncbi:MAG: PqqD family peptide modification chaperone [Gammaproteobacteria bacterium]|uniref:PqqD family peptide modification chaperone n=1 Tax=Thioalbus denitrificans TaxID=547122 RepID=UPI00147495F8|nr:PqqD family peptide modification chaperone [Thioalbus denitrificans]MDD3448070.1 PqqD family peptide modification chaperone [Gammaproteobacteria bacterium]